MSLLNAQIDSNPSDPLYLTADLSQVYTDTDPRTYELSYYSYLIVPTASTPTDPLTLNQGYSLGAFGSYALCQGQQQIDNLGYSALPINLVEDGYAQLQKIPGAEVPATTSEFIQGCNNPTFSPDGTDKLATNDPMPPACDQQGTAQCATTSNTLVTFTTLTASPNPAAAGQPVTLTATVAPAGGTATPTGSVQFEVSGTDLGSPVALDSSGVASTTATFASAGTQEVSALYMPTDPTAFDSSANGVSMVTVARSDSVGIAVTVTNPPAGAFTFTVPANAMVTLTQRGDSALGVMADVTVSDTRNTYPGWSVVGQVSDFTSPTSNPAGDISGNQLGWGPDGSLGDGAALGGAVAPAAPGLGTAAAVLAYADPGSGFGTNSMGASLLLAIPRTVPSGNYSGELTLTAEPAGP